MAEPDRLQLGKPVAAAGAAEEDRELVADQLAAAAGEDRRPVGEARPVLLAAVSGRSSDAAGVRIDFAKDLGVAPADWIGRGGRKENRLKEGGWDGEVSEKSLAMSPCGLFSCREEAEQALPRRPSESCGMKNSQRPPPAETVGCTMLGTESQNGNSG